MTSRFLASLQALKKQMRPGEIVLDPATCADYAGDKWFARRQPDAVARPRDAKAVAQLMHYASRKQIPVTPRGAGYGYVGGCVPIQGGIALSLERMNRILEINPHDFVGIVQPGVITAQFQAEVKNKASTTLPTPPAGRTAAWVETSRATRAGPAASNTA